jgi:hypothetical protein
MTIDFLTRAVLFGVIQTHSGNHVQTLEHAVLEIVAVLLAIAVEPIQTECPTASPTREPRQWRTDVGEANEATYGPCRLSRQTELLVHPLALLRGNQSPP